MTKGSIRFVVLAAIVTVAVGAVAEAQVDEFTKTFIPPTIGPGSTSTLRFTIVNSDAVNPLSDLAFVDTLPAGVVIATPASGTSACGGSISAPDGGGSTTFNGGQLGAGSSCTITVNVSSSTPGTYSNTSGVLTSSQGSHGTASADLVVDVTLPGITKSFAPGTVSFGGTSSLTFAVDNTAVQLPLAGLTFADTLPPGMTVATPSNLATTCGGTVTAVSGSGLVSLVGGSVGAGTSCTVSVDVVGAAAGSLGNTSSILSWSGGSAGMASAVLLVDPLPQNTLLLQKSFVDDPVAPGETVNLQFTVRNQDRTGSATGITFSDNLEAVLTGLTPSAGLPSAPCGASSSLGFAAGVLQLTGGSLGAGELCTFAVQLLVPASVAQGGHVNTTTQLQGELGGNPVSGDPATDTLVVIAAPILTKEFTDDPVGGGQDVTLEFTITSTNPDQGLFDIGFTDVLTTFLPFPVTATVPAPGFCGPSSQMILVNSGTSWLQMIGGELDAAGGANDSCTFSVTITIPAGMPGGAYLNTTGPITAAFSNETPVTGRPAADSLLVAGAPSLLKEFTNDPVLPGDTATLEFTISHDEFAVADATAIQFTDNLNAALTGLVATGLPLTDVCGVGSAISGTSTLSFAGGSLAPGESCTFSVNLQVPATALPGSHTNTTSAVLATVGGAQPTGNPASDDLRVAGLTLTKQFTDDPALPGGTVTLRFTLENVSSTSTATGISFQDNIGATLANLAATGLPLADPCGAGSSLTGAAGNTFLQFQGGTLGPGSSCFFDVVLQVPSGAASGFYSNVTTGFSALIDGTPATLDNAHDQLEVNDTLLVLSKTFTDDPAIPGGTVTLELLLDNLDLNRAASAIAFTDDLGAALAGLTISAVLLDDCGGVLGGVGTDQLSYSGGSLPAGGSCTVRLVLDVPAGPLPGYTFTNTTSTVTGTINGFAVSGPAATDDLRIDIVDFTKSFLHPAAAGSLVPLSFTITNLNAGEGISNLAFTDDLSTVVTGLVATGLPISDVCGAGSQISGTSFLSLTGGSLLPGGSCSFTVMLELPAGAVAGTYPNATTSLASAGLQLAGPAVADLLVLDASILITKAAQAATVPAGSTASFNIVVRNTGSVG